MENNSKCGHKARINPFPPFRRNHKRHKLML